MRAGHGLRAVVGVALVALAGCGAGRGDLSGTVSYQGKAVESGSVAAVGSDGQPRTGFIADGRYEVKDLPAGPVKLAVSSPDPGKVPRRSLRGGPAPAKADRTGWFPLPEKYADLSKSELTADLTAGPNTHDIDLK